MEFTEITEGPIPTCCVFRNLRERGDLPHLTGHPNFLAPKTRPKARVRPGALSKFAGQRTPFIQAMPFTCLMQLVYIMHMTCLCAADSTITTASLFLSIYKALEGRKIGVARRPVVDCRSRVAVRRLGYCATASKEVQSSSIDFFEIY